jgi:hypothetical protein
MDCYDYAGAVLFNAHAGILWRRLTIYLTREVARTAGLTRTALKEVARVSFVKVAEYQARGVIHFHAVVRIDGPDGPGERPPEWADAVMLDECLRRAIAAVGVDVPAPAGDGLMRLRFGGQIDTQLIVDDDEGADNALTITAVSRYVAKYATKSSETAGGVPHRIKQPWHIDYLGLPPHTERLVRTCFALAERGEYAELRLDRWAHMLGYRGHCTTKSRRYSTTFGEIRGARRENREAERRARLDLPSLDGRDVLVESDWRFVQSGLAHGEAPLVAAMRPR